MDQKQKKPSRQEAEEAIRVLIRWAGDDPDREGLQRTPERVIDAYKSYFSGYTETPEEHLHCTFDEVNDYDEMVMLRNIRFESHCEHHMAPIIGYAHVAYLPNKCVVGISKLARVVDIYAKRLQIQEKMTSQIANAIDDILNPRGVAVVIEASHQCLTCRGVHKTDVVMMTSCMKGIFKESQELRREALDLMRSRKGEMV